MTNENETQTENENSDDKVNCIACDVALSEDETYNFNGDVYCLDCYEENTFSCDRCGERAGNGEGYYIENIGHSYCQNCTDNYTSYCEGCSNTLTDDCFCSCGDRLCSDCCEHSTETREINIPFKIEKSKTFKENKFKETCGLEIECINSNRHFFNYKDLEKFGFNQQPDGSLSANGIEFSSNVFNGDLLFKKIEQFCKELKKHKYNINSSCGLHIHIKIPKTLNYLRKVVLFYSKYEPFIFAMLPRSRQINGYCRKLFSSYNISPNETKKEYLNNLNELKYKIYKTRNRRYINDRLVKQHYNENRYCWLNLHSVFYRGTLEIRNHNATLNADKIKNWFKIHLQILDFIKKINLSTIHQLPNTKEMFLSIFTEDIQKYIIERYKEFQEVNQLCEDEINNLKEIII